MEPQLNGKPTHPRPTPWPDRLLDLVRQSADQIGWLVELIESSEGMERRTAIHAHADVARAAALLERASRRVFRRTTVWGVSPAERRGLVSETRRRA
jgi:hypothetical protein